MELLSGVKISENASSIWGYTDPKGHEYAILGTAQGVRIYALQDPAQPKELTFIQCSASSWRELKTAGDFAYVTTEAEDGLLIIDLRSITDSLPYRFVKSFKDILGDSLSIISAHTLFVDDKNFIYLAGARPIGSGFIILDPTSDPFNPIVISHNEDHYQHEVHAYHDTLYGAELFNGVFSIWDIKDRENPVRLFDHETSYHFTHSVWIEKDRNILYTTDEVASAVVEAWNVSDPTDIRKTDEYKVKNPHAPYIIPHNVFHKDGLLYVSYYTEGVRILDTNDPENLLEVAYYDTHEEHLDGFHGCWSVYPYFKSGICIASDIENGLFVLKYDGNKPVYIEVEIVDKADDSPISNASFKIEQGNRSIEEFSNLQGIVKTGFPEEDSVTIQVYKKGYYPELIRARLDKGVFFTIKVELQELPKFDLKVVVKNKTTGKLIQDAKLLFYNADYSINGSTGDSGESLFHNVYQNHWTLVIGKWAYKQYVLNNFELMADTTIEVELDEGYEDDFILDLGWTSTGTDPNVNWNIGDFMEIPIPSSNFPSRDIPGDIGNSCYYTDNYNSFETEFNIHGTVFLKSPMMDLSNYESIDLSYYAWAYGGFTSTKEILLATQDTSIVLEPVQELLTGQFNPQSNIHVDLSHLRKDSVQFVFRLFNDSATAEMAIRLMGALDVFRLTGNKIVSVKKPLPDSPLELFPNPASNYLYLKSKDQESCSDLKIYNTDGLLLKSIHGFYNSKAGIDISELNAGVYFIKLNEKNSYMRFIKMN
jgi:choice-of-anchor B domain-containing protein